MAPLGRAHAIAPASAWGRKQGCRAAYWYTKFYVGSSPSPLIKRNFEESWRLNKTQVRSRRSEVKLRDAVTIIHFFIAKKSFKSVPVTIFQTVNKTLLFWRKKNTYLLLTLLVCFSMIAFLCVSTYRFAAHVRYSTTWPDLATEFVFAQRKGGIRLSLLSPPLLRSISSWSALLVLGGLYSRAFFWPRVGGILTAKPNVRFDWLRFCSSSFK